MRYYRETWTVEDDATRSGCAKMSIVRWMTQATLKVGTRVELRRLENERRDDGRETILCGLYGGETTDEND